MATLEQLTPQESVANLRNAGLTKQADNVEKAFKESGAITSADLKPQSNFITTPPPVATAGAGLSGAVDSLQDDFTKNLEQQRKDAEAMKKDSQSDYIKSILGTEGEVTSTAKAYSEKGGVDTIQTELDDINQQIRVEQNALRRQIEKTQTTPGLTKGQIDLETSEMERVSLRKMADLSIIQQGVQGRYDSAKSIADRAVAVKMEQQKIKNEALRIQYEDNKDLFNKTEQRQFESLLADRERKFAKEEADETAKYNSAIEAQKNGAPTSVIKAMLDSNTKEDALAVGGSYIGLLDRQAAGRAARKDLFDMALLGDKQSISALGYDPREYTKEAQEEKQKEEATYDSALDVVDTATRLLDDDLGLRSAVATGPINQFITTLGLGAQNLLSKSDRSIVNRRDESLTKIGKLVEKETIDALGNMPVKLTPMTNEDVALIRRSASELGGNIRYGKNNEPIRLVGSETENTRIITEMLGAYQRVVDTMSRAGITNTELDEAMSVWQKP
jgi:hypothetical protein